MPRRRASAWSLIITIVSLPVASRRTLTTSPRWASAAPGSRPRDVVPRLSLVRRSRRPGPVGTRRRARTRLCRCPTHGGERDAKHKDPTGTKERSFLLQRVQPAMTGLIDGSLSKLAPISSVVLAAHRPHYTFVAGWRPLSAPVSAWPSARRCQTPRPDRPRQPRSSAARLPARDVPRRHPAHARLPDLGLPRRARGRGHRDRPWAHGTRVDRSERRPHRAPGNRRRRSPRLRLHVQDGSWRLHCQPLDL
jgi:hypothetical protein